MLRQNRSPVVTGSPAYAGDDNHWISSVENRALARTAISKCPSRVPQVGASDRVDFRARHFCANEMAEKIATPHRQSRRSGYVKSGT
jgi:hypothetical protein